MKTMKSIMLCAVLTLFAVGLVLYPAEVSAAVRLSAERCLNVLIPSLFAFMAVSAMLISSGSAAMLSRPFRLFSRYILRMPDSLFAVMLISFAAGYPVGVKLISDMLDKGEIDEKTASSAASFCYCGGPAFYSGAVGLAVFGSRDVGTLIFLSVLSADLVLAVVVCRFSELKAKTVDKHNKGGALLVSSVNSAGKSMAAVCMTVIFFSSMTALCDCCGLFSFIQRLFGLTDNGMTVLKAFIELTSLTELEGCPYNLLPVICAACSFGGVCIIMQLFALKSERMSLLRFIELRPLAAVLSALFCKLYQPKLIGAAVFTISSNKSLCKINNLGASICLILMIFLLNFKKTLVISERV